MDIQYEYVYYNNPASESDRHKRQSRNPYAKLKTLAELGEPEWVTEELKRTFHTMDLSEDQYNWLMIWYKIASRDGVLPRITEVKNSGTNKEPLDETLNDTYYLQNDSTFRGIEPVPYATMFRSAEQDCESNAEQDYESSAEQDYEPNAEQDYESSVEQDHEYIAKQESRPEQEYESSPEQVYRSTAEQVYRPADAQTQDISAAHVYDLYESSEEQVYGISAGQVYNSYDSSEKQVHGISAGHTYGSYDSSTKQVYGTNREQIYRSSAEQLYRSSPERVYATNPEQTYNSNTTSEEWQPMFEYYSKRQFGPTDKGKIDSIVSVHASNDGGVGHVLSSVDSRDYDDSIHETLDSMSSRNSSKVSSTNNTRAPVQMPSTGCSPFLQRHPQPVTQMETFVQNSGTYNHRHRSSSCSNNSQDVPGRSLDNLIHVPSDILAELDELVRREAASADKDVSGWVYDSTDVYDERKKEELSVVHDDIDYYAKSSY
ncbi:hypothetical protein C8J55DRAFT_484919 [Lentinula edodes]|uniref:Uncharacterized protein n=1 Tax=Lentinula lateritia TaxID=40482 RepID=A0A9W9DZX9_9AGAR|nr:hypothetical protein C8J55DRAFT_484919 [Lentinula edodes]